MPAITTAREHFAAALADLPEMLPSYQRRAERSYAAAVTIAAGALGAWSAIGEATGTTRQSAQQRWGKTK